MDKNRLELNRKKGETLENAVYESLKGAIYSGYLPPGSRLVESTLVKELNVGRTPIREAIKKLGAEGLVKIIPNKGATIVRLSPDEVEEMYLIAGVLEGVAAANSVKRLEPEDIKRLKDLHNQMKDKQLLVNYAEWMQVNYRFHHIYLKASQKPLLLRKIKEVDKTLPLYWYMCCSLPEIGRTSIEKHQEIVNAFENRNAELARRKAEEHLIIIGKILKEHLQKIPRMI